MNIQHSTVVQIDYTLTDDRQQVIDSSAGGEPLTYLHGHGNLIPGLEKELEGRKVGEAFKISIPPGEAYGERDERKRQTVPRSAFQGIDRIEPGMRFRASGPEGEEAVLVLSVSEKEVVVDGNHPLAGQTLHFDVTVRGVRAATEEEVAHGHVHGPGGHHH